MPSLVFKDAEQARDSICIEDQRKIRDLYAEWADKVAERAEYYEKKTTASSYWQQQQMIELERQLRSQSMQIHKEIESGSKSSMYIIADSVVGCNAEFLKTLGFKEEGINAAFTSVPNRVVSNIVTGQIYKSGWSLSKAIWTDNQKTLSDIYSIVAQGRAMNMSAYEVSKMLERYVSPSRKMQWNLKMRDGVKIYKKTVDYNAQRLVRTLNQHAYQQSVIQVAKDNPFIQGIYWRANGSRVCPLCMDRDGNFYKWNEIPMDHPNGMCTMEPAIDMDKTIDQLADWIKEPDGTYPEIDKFAEKLGYEPKNKMIVQVNNSNQKTNSEHYVVQGKDITSTWKRRSDQFDFEIEDVINAQGFDGLPRVASKEEFDEAVKAANGGNGFIAQRTYSAPDQETLDAYRDQLYNGKWYVDCSVGTAAYGQGMYGTGDFEGHLTDNIKKATEFYTNLNKQKGNQFVAVETFTLSPDAKLADYKKLTSDFMKYGMDVQEKNSEIRRTSRNEANKILAESLLKDAGYYSDDAKKFFYGNLSLENVDWEEMGKAYQNLGKEGVNALNKLQSEYYKKQTSFVDEYVNKQLISEIKDIGSFAASKGYDGISVVGFGVHNSNEVVILNRTKVIILEDN